MDHLDCHQQSTISNQARNLKMISSTGRIHFGGKGNKQQHGHAQLTKSTCIFLMQTINKLDEKRRNIWFVYSPCEPIFIGASWNLFQKFKSIQLLFKLDMRKISIHPPTFSFLLHPHPHYYDDDDHYLDYTKCHLI